MLLTLASNLVLFLYREGSHPLKTRRVAIPCSMKSDWTPSPHSTERYLPVINTIVDNTIINFRSNTFNIFPYQHGI